MTNKKLKEKLHARLSEFYINAQHQFGDNESFHSLMIDCLIDLIGYNAACLIENEVVTLEKAIEMSQKDIKTVIQLYRTALKANQVNNLTNELANLEH